MLDMDELNMLAAFNIFCLFFFLSQIDFVETWEKAVNNSCKTWTTVKGKSRWSL